MRIAAEDIPNLREERTIVPGLLTREGVQRFAREYGTDSPFYVGRVLAEFPEQATDSLVEAGWVEGAVKLWQSDGAPWGRVFASSRARFERSKGTALRTRASPLPAWPAPGSPS